MNGIDDIYENIEEGNPNNKRKILINFNDMIADMLNNKKFHPVVTELFMRGRKLNISLVFITQSYFTALKNIRLNPTHYFIMKIPKEQELRQISSDMDFKDFMNLYQKRCSTMFFFSY